MSVRPVLRLGHRGRVLTARQAVKWVLSGPAVEQGLCFRGRPAGLKLTVLDELGRPHRQRLGRPDAGSDVRVHRCAQAVTLRRPVPCPQLRLTPTHRVAFKYRPVDGRLRPVNDQQNLQATHAVDFPGAACLSVSRLDGSKPGERWFRDTVHWGLEGCQISFTWDGRAVVFLHEVGKDLVVLRAADGAVLVADPLPHAARRPTPPASLINCSL